MTSSNHKNPVTHKTKNREIKRQAIGLKSSGYNKTIRQHKNNRALVLGAATGMAHFCSSHALNPTSYSKSRTLFPSKSTFKHLSIEVSCPTTQPPDERSYIRQTTVIELVDLWKTTSENNLVQETKPHSQITLTRTGPHLRAEQSVQSHRPLWRR